ncbi:MAG: hypothetical protein IKM06_02895, partial [Clostridia bacterium]|nr:hypothetical protein [Clostridia bacterium]
TGTSNNITYCIETNYGEIIEVYKADGHIPYWDGANVPLFESVYVPGSAWDSEPVKNMRSVNQTIYDAAYKRFEAVYTQPEYYPYLIE